MKKLKKNFHEQSRTVEAMSGTCLNGCDCAAGICACSDQSTISYNNWKTEWNNYTKGYERADF